MNKELRAWLVLTAWVLIGTTPIMCAAKTQQPAEEEICIESTKDTIKWKINNAKQEKTAVEPLDVYQAELYNVPLSGELQLHIFQECEKHNIAPAIILALIEYESNFDADEVSTHGAKGLMQIVPKWHKDRMERLGCTDLMDPYQNVTVGIDFIAELKDKDPDLYWVLMAYNGGEAYATRKIKAEDYSDYAVKIVERASELEEEHEYLQSLVK